jgi:hypothetical protein
MVIPHASLGVLLSKASYGLISSRGIQVTDLGIDDAEKNSVYKEALLNIPLWKELFGKFGKTLPDSNFWANLVKSLD